MSKKRKAQEKAATAGPVTRGTPTATLAADDKPVRITVDLAPELYQQLTRWSTETALELDLPRLPLAATVRAFIRALDAPAVAAEVRTTLRMTRQ
jgi:hypothetical protein